jgi:small-conductance mechanosensitive channel
MGLFLLQSTRQQALVPKAVLIRRLTVLIVTIFAITLAPGAFQNPSAATPDAPTTIQFLSQAVDWYRQSQREPQIATGPGDLTFVFDNRRMADQVVKLAFDFARQQEQLEAKQSKLNQSQTQNSNLSQYQSLVQAATDADHLVQQTQDEVQSLKRRLESTPGGKRAQLETLISETESELGLFQARQQALHSMVEFASGASSAKGTAGLRVQIEELGRTVPAAVSGSSGEETNTAVSSQSYPPVSGSINKQPPSGIWGLSADLFRLSSNRSALADEMRATQALQQRGEQIRAPLVTSLKQLIQGGDQLARQADTSDQAALAQEKQQLDTLTTQFKQVSAVLAPLSKQTILLDLYRRSLTNWQAALKSQSKEEMRVLGARLVVLLVLLGIVAAIGEVWRRTIFRYVPDARRRYQFLLMRKVVLWVAVAMILVFTFVTELGSVATFAGLITAGVALALQNVIVSIVGYFFLIGKFGIRVGDRVQVSGVTGEVVDIGLVRFHLMELGNAAADSQPTGRVVAFSNAIVFQPTAGLFKQIPGTDFIWHEIELSFAPESDYRVVRDRVDKAMEAAFAEYRENMERQRRQMEISLSSVAATELKPKTRIHFTPSAIEVMIRFPVVVQKANEIDDRIMRELFAAVDREPKLKLLGSQIPAVKAEA